jgi:hypothetical protein
MSCQRFLGRTTAERPELVFAGMGATRLYLQRLDLSGHGQLRLVAERIMPCWRAMAWPAQRVGRSSWVRLDR